MKQLGDVNQISRRIEVVIEVVDDARIAQINRAAIRCKSAAGSGSGHHSRTDEARMAGYRRKRAFPRTSRCRQNPLGHRLGAQSDPKWYSVLFINAAQLISSLEKAHKEAGQCGIFRIGEIL